MEELVFLLLSIGEDIINVAIHMVMHGFCIGGGQEHKHEQGPFQSTPLGIPVVIFDNDLNVNPVRDIKEEIYGVLAFFKNTAGGVSCDNIIKLEEEDVLEKIRADTEGPE